MIGLIISIAIIATLFVYVILLKFSYRKKLKKNKPLELDILLPPPMAENSTYNSEPKKYVPES